MFGNTSFDSNSGLFTGGGGTIEPAYNDSTGTLVYLRTPNNTKSAKNLPDKMVPFDDLGFSLPVNVAPIFLPVYPTGWFGNTPPTLNCSDGPPENCPDHGPLIAGIAAGDIFPGLGVPSVYGNGVMGHDHLVGVAKTGGDFNVLWEPVLVLFKSPTADKGIHVTTLQQITDLYNSGDVKLVPLPPATFACSVEGPAAYEKATPATS